MWREERQIDEPRPSFPSGSDRLDRMLRQDIGEMPFTRPRWLFVNLKPGVQVRGIAILNVSLLIERVLQQRLVEKSKEVINALRCRARQFARMAHMPLADVVGFVSEISSEFCERCDFG